MSIAIVFEKENIIGKDYVSKRLEQDGFKVDRNSAIPHMVLVSISQEALEREGERVNLLIQNNKNLLQHFQIENKSDFMSSSRSNLNIFQPSERNLLLLSLMEQVTIDKQFNEIAKEHSCSEGAELIVAAKAAGIIECLFPPHDHELRDKLFTKAMYALPCDKSVIHEIYSYFGSEVAMYFAFMDHFTLWLIPSGLFGFGIAIWNHIDVGMDVDNNLIIPLFSVFLIAWAILFGQYWKQTSSSYACKWGTLGKTGRDTSREDFHGKLVKSKVTGLMEKQYPWYRRIPYYILSLLVTGVMLCVAFAVMIISLNLQGYIKENAIGAQYLHFPRVAHYARPGMYFDPNGEGPYPTFLPLAPVVLHAVVIMGLNTIYRHIAEWLTTLENHRTDREYQNSLILKRILFDGFDCYIALFYLAFCKFDINALRNDLFGLYTTDSIRRVATESILPWVVNKWESKTMKDEIKSKKNDEVDQSKKKKGSTPPSSLTSLEDEFVLDEYEAFDDYLEMVIAFGYVTLFASAFPLASALTIICVVVEARSDMFKMCWVVRRPLPEQVSDIGTWSTVLVGMAWLSIVTNSFIFAFTTEQMMQVFPSFFVIADAAAVGADRQHVFAPGMAQYVWAGLFFIEHVLFLFASAVCAIVPDSPEWVKEEQARQAYAKLQESKQLKKIQKTRAITAEVVDSSPAALQQKPVVNSLLKETIKSVLKEEKKAKKKKN